MLSKSIRQATTVLITSLMCACASMVPWGHEEPATEVNLAFSVERNLLLLPSAQVNGTSGRIIFGSSQPQTILDPAFAARLRSQRYELNMNQRESLSFTPLMIGLGGVADAIVGSDVWDSHAVTIDYRSGLVTYQKEGIHPDYMTLFRFTGEPAVVGQVGGQAMTMVVDTTLPDTLVLPRGDAAAGRKRVRVTIAGTDFGDVDVALGNVTTARLGNRLLSRFLVSIDYGQREVGLWRDPRIPLR